MKNTIYILLFFLIVSCNEEKDCLEYGGNSGLIEYEVDMGKCYSFLDTPYILIADTNAYKKLPQYTNDSIQQSLGCAPSPSRPDLNFDSIMLVGAKTEATGCIVTYERDIEFNSNNKIITYKIDVHQCGACNETRFSMNWVAIEKIEDTEDLEVMIDYY